MQTRGYRPRPTENGNRVKGRVPEMPPSSEKDRQAFRKPSQFWDCLKSQKREYPVE